MAKKKPTMQYMDKYVGNDRGIVAPENKIKSNGGKPAAQKNRPKTSSTMTAYGKPVKKVVAAPMYATAKKKKK